MQVVEHISEAAIERYRARTSTPAEWLSVQAHISGCVDCRARLARAVEIDNAALHLQQELIDNFNSEEQPEHLPYEQLALYVDGELDEVEREITESHLAICQDCAGDVADLRRYQAIATEPMPVTAPVAAAATKIRQVSPQEKQSVGWPSKFKSLRQRLFSFEFFPSFGALVPAAVAAVVIAVLILGVWLAMRSDSQSKRSNEIAQVEPRNQESTNPSTVTATPSVEPSASPVTKPRQSPRDNELPANSAPLLALNDASGRVTLDAQGNVLGLESLSPSARAAVRESLRNQSAPRPPALNALAGSDSGVLMSGSETNRNNGVPFALVSPVGKVVRSNQPVLRWRPHAGATGYTVAVVDANFRVVAQSPSLDATEWTPSNPLPRGANYSWQVTALQADGKEVISPSAPAPQAKFRVLEQNLFNELAQLEQSGGQSHLARGVMYARAGLLEEASAEFEALVRANPRSPLARKLLKSVRR